jgi:photosystem II stability/assembly factor-like uncharacterized protein
MSFPVYYISTSVMNVNTFTTSKIVMLPPASTIQGMSLYVRDWSGLAETNPIYVSTQLNDLMDNYASTILLDRAYQSFCVVPYSTTRYAITANYTEGLTPYQYAIQLLTEYFEVSLTESWVTVAVSPDSTYMLAVASGGTNDGFYTSIDSGVSFSQYVSRAGSFTACAMGSRFWFVCDSAGVTYRSQDQGQTWLPLSFEFVVLAIACNQNGDYVVIVDQNRVYYSSDGGVSFQQVTTINIGEASITNVAIGDAPSQAQDDIVVYVTTTDSGMGDGFIYVTTNLTEGNPFNPYGPNSNWTCVSCNLAGDTAYALSSNGQLYKSTDTGQNWTLLTTPEPFYNTQIRCSSDGQIFYGIDGSGQRYITEDGGTNFTAKGDMLFGMLTQYGLSSNGLTSLFAVANTALYPGRTRLV